MTTSPEVTPVTARKDLSVTQLKGSGGTIPGSFQGSRTEVRAQLQTLPRGDVPASVRGRPCWQPDQERDKPEAGRGGPREARPGHARCAQTGAGPRGSCVCGRRGTENDPLKGFPSAGSDLPEPVTGLGPSQRWDFPEGSSELPLSSQRPTASGEGGTSPKDGVSPLLCPPPGTPLFPKEEVLCVQEG